MQDEKDDCAAGLASREKEINCGCRRTDGQSVSQAVGPSKGLQVGILLHVLQMGLVRAQVAKVMAQRRNKGMILAVHLVGALWLLASDRGGHLLGVERTAIRTAATRRPPRDEGPRDERRRQVVWFVGRGGVGGAVAVEGRPRQRRRRGRPSPSGKGEKMDISTTNTNNRGT